MYAPVTVFLPDGRILRLRSDESAAFTDPQRPQSRHVQYFCEKPFRNWTYAINELPVWVTSKEELGAGVVADKLPTTTVSLEARATMMAPVYRQGGLLPEAADAIEGEAGLWLAARLPGGMTPEAFRFDHMNERSGPRSQVARSFPNMRGFSQFGRPARHALMGPAGWATPGGTGWKRA